MGADHERRLETTLPLSGRAPISSPPRRHVADRALVVGRTEKISKTEKSRPVGPSPRRVSSERSPLFRLRLMGPLHPRETLPRANGVSAG